MQGITPTIVGLQDTLSRQYGTVDPITEASTINAYLGIAPVVTTGPRTTKVFMLGSDGRSPRSAALPRLYKTLPLISRPLSAPLTVDERMQYRFRIETTRNGIGYEVYYGKVLPPLQLISTIQYTTFATPTGPHSISTLPPVNITDEWTDSTANQSIVEISAPVDIEFTDIDIASMVEACAVLGITDTTIRELAFCSGVEVTTSETIELHNAICTFHVTLDSPLVPPGIQVQCGSILGVFL